MPAEQYFTVFRAEAALMAMGRYFVVSGVAMVLVISGVWVGTSSAAKLEFAVIGGTLAFVTCTFTVMLWNGILAAFTFEEFIGHILPRTLCFFSELANVAFTIGLLTTMKKLHSELEYCLHYTFI